MVDFLEHLAAPQYYLSLLGPNTNSEIKSNR